jgi:hypothetical protein
MSINEPIADDAGGGTRSKVREKAAEFADGAKQQASSFYDKKKSTVVSEIGNFASILRQAGEAGDAGIAGRLAAVAAERIETWSNAADAKDLDDVLHEVEAFARRSPALFIGGAMVIGFAASRFVKSSARNLSTNNYSSEAYGGYRAGTTGSAIGSAGGSAGFDTTGSTGTGSSTTGSTGSSTRGTTSGVTGTTDWGTGGGSL